MSGKVAVKLEDGKTKEFDKGDIEIVDADVNVDIDDEKTRKHIITVKTCVKMKRINNNIYERSVPIYESNLKILVPILRGVTL
jgi:hypothetical protein